MAFPLLFPWSILARGALFLGGGVAAVYFGRRMRGRTLCVLGERQVGKTTLADFLATKKISTGYEQTIHEDVTRIWRVEFDKGKPPLTKIIDLPGGPGYKKAWKDAVAGCNTVVYLFRADHLHASSLDTTRVLSDSRHIRGWLKEDQRHRLVCLVGTHCDLIDEYNALTNKTMGDFTDKMTDRSPLPEMRRALGCDNVVFGSLKNTSSAKKLVSGMARAFSKK